MLIGAESPYIHPFLSVRSCVCLQKEQEDKAGGGSLDKAATAGVKAAGLNPTVSIGDVASAIAAATAAAAAAVAQGPTAPTPTADPGGAPPPAAASAPEDLRKKFAGFLGNILRPSRTAPPGSSTNPAKGDGPTAPSGTALPSHASGAALAPASTNTPQGAGVVPPPPSPPGSNSCDDDFRIQLSSSSMTIKVGAKSKHVCGVSCHSVSWRSSLGASNATPAGAARHRDSLPIRGARPLSSHQGISGSAACLSLRFSRRSNACAQTKYIAEEDWGYQGDAHVQPWAAVDCRSSPLPISYQLPSCCQQKGESSNREIPRSHPSSSSPSKSKGPSDGLHLYPFHGSRDVRIDGGCPSTNPFSVIHITRCQHQEPSLRPSRRCFCSLSIPGGDDSATPASPRGGI